MMMVEGILGLSVWQAIGVALILTHITIASVTIYLHRHQAHHALDLHPIAAHFFRFWLWLTTGITTRNWVAIHRKHHAAVERADDPHSPQILGIRKVLFEGLELYREAGKDRAMVEKYGHGTPDDWIERHLYRHDRSGIALMLLIDLALFGLAGIAVWGIQMLWIPFFAAGVINGIGHWWGYRNYEVPDASRNIVPWGILIGGEELHNNHHTFTSSAKLSSKWWEIDIGWLYIRLLSCVGLAQVRKVATRPLRDPAKATLDMETMRAVVTHRFQVLAHYGYEVLERVRRDERLPRRVRHLLMRDESLIDTHARQQIDVLLNDNERLATVYCFKQRLQALWSSSSASNEALLHGLQEWCRQAEASGISALEDFVRVLRSYSIKGIKGDARIKGLRPL